MHELSIAMSIVDMAIDEASRRGAERVDAVHMKIGRLSGVVPRALQSSFELACEHTPLEGSALVIEDVPVSVLCGACGVEREVESIQHMACSVCGTPSADIVRGREIVVSALELS
ncbi:MAG: hydrogenase maturation nickel metallochaperone HypA [Vicinamibacterales bacterium]